VPDREVWVLVGDISGEGTLRKLGLKQRLFDEVIKFLAIALPLGDVRKRPGAAMIAPEACQLVKRWHDMLGIVSRQGSDRIAGGGGAGQAEPQPLLEHRIESRLKFREYTGKFIEFGLGHLNLAPKGPVKSMGHAQIPYETKQGINCGVAGN
jgi:hypothetical protein